MSPPLPQVELQLPAVLEVMVGTRRLSLRGRTLPELLEAAFAEQPALRDHLTLEDGGIRPHVLFLLNGESLLREDFPTVELADGDELRVHQAISGG